MVLLFFIFWKDLIFSVVSLTQTYNPILELLRVLMLN